MHEYAITRMRHRDGFKVLEVDTAQAHLFGTPWKMLGGYGKRKFENLLVIKNSEDKIKIIYA